MQLREVIAPKKWRESDTTEDVIRVSKPEAEVKYGATCRNFYIQVSVSEQHKLTDVNDKVLGVIQKFCTPKPEESQPE